jgi:hypothetical protein
MANRVRQSAQFTNLSASAQIKPGNGVVYGFIVNSHTSGTIKLWNSLTAANAVICNTITLAAGPQVYTFPVGAEFSIGLFCTIGGTADITLIWE